MAEQVQEPSDDFVRFFASRVYSGRLTKAVRERFAEITKQALEQYIKDRINRRLESALQGEKQETQPPEEPVPDYEEPEQEEDSKIETIEAERDGYLIVKSIVRQEVDASRIVMRDVQTYCGILLDDNNRQPICRLHFNTSQKYLGLIDEDKNEERVPIDELDEIYEYADQLRAAAHFYD